MVLKTSELLLQQEDLDEATANLVEDVMETLTQNVKLTWNRGGFKDTQSCAAAKLGAMLERQSRERDDP